MFRWRLTVVKLVGPLVVEDGSPAVELPLLTLEIRSRWLRDVGLERFVHPLVGAVLLRARRLRGDGLNAKRYQPDAQLAQPEQRVGRPEGHAVVGEDGFWKSVPSKQTLEYGLRVNVLRAEMRLACEQIPAAQVGDGERVTIDAVFRSKLAFVVRRPNVVRRFSLYDRRTRM